MAADGRLNDRWKDTTAARGRPSPVRELVILCREARAKLERPSGRSWTELSDELRRKAVLAPTPATGGFRRSTSDIQPLQVCDGWARRMQSLQNDTDRGVEKLHDAMAEGDRPALAVAFWQGELSKALDAENRHGQMEAALPCLWSCALDLADELDSQELQEQERLLRSARSCRERPPSGDFDLDGDITGRALAVGLRLLALGPTSVFLSVLPACLRPLWAGPLPSERYVPLPGGSALVQHEGAQGPDGPLYAVLEVGPEALGRFAEAYPLLTAAAPWAVSPPVALHASSLGCFQLVVFVAERLGEPEDEPWRRLSEVRVWRTPGDLGTVMELTAHRIVLSLVELLVTLHTAGMVLGRKCALREGILVRVDEHTGHVALRLAATVGPRPSSAAPRVDTGVPEKADGEPADVHWAAQVATEICGTGTARSVAPFLARSPEDRPPAGKLAEELALLDCECCTEVRRLVEMASCSEGHSVCLQCLERCCRSGSNPRSVARLGALRCPYSEGAGLGGCNYTLQELIWAGLPAAAAEAHLEAQVRIRERVAEHVGAERESALACSRALQRRRELLEDTFLEAGVYSEMPSRTHAGVCVPRQHVD
jgi:hypothetical protein